MNLVLNSRQGPFLIVLLFLALLAEDFLEKTASQLTYFGLTELISNVKDKELSILFRNNHFITLYKFQVCVYEVII